jgi:zinc protease
MRHCLLSFLLLTCTFPALAGLKQDPNLIKGTLSNGLTYYIYPNDYPKGEAVYRLFIKSGSVYETEEQRGLAHFIEHMAFNGTKHFPGDGIIRFLESKGAKFGVDLNAHTSFNETVYKLQLPTSDPAMVDSTFLILSDWANGLLLDSLEIEQERGVIFSEWLSKSGPEKDAQNAFLMELLNESRYSERIVIGDTGVILGCSHQALRNYYEQWYHPKRMAIAVSGDVDPKQAKALIKKYFGSIKAPRTTTPPYYGIPLYENPRLTVVSHPSLKKIEYNHIQLLPPFEPINSKKGYQDYLKRTLLNRLLKARLAALTFEDLPYKNGSVSLSSFLNTSGVLLVSAELIPGKVNEGLNLFNQHVEQLYQYGFLNLEIDKVKKIYLSQLKRKATSKTPTPSESFMNDLYANFFVEQQMVTAQTEYALALKYLPSIDSLTFVSLLEEVVKPQQTRYFMTAFDQVAGEIPSEENHLAYLDSLRHTTMTPYYKAVDVPDVLLTQQPKPGRVIEETKIEPIETLRIKLSNGATVYYRKSLSDRERIQLTGYREGGIYAMDSAAFVSGIYAGSIIGLSGAGNFTRDALSHYLAGNTASVRLLTERNRSGIAASAGVDDMETMFELLYLKWTQPRIDTAVFEQTKRQSIEAYRTQNRTASTVFYQDLQYLLNGRNYVTRELTDTLLERDFQLDWLMPAFQHSFGSADGYTFILMSDCEYAELEPYVLRYLGGLPSGKASTTYVYEGSQSPVEDINFQRKAGDAPKATVSLIFQGTPISEGMSTFELKNELMKTVLRTYLLKELREELGMVYSVGVSVSGTKHPADLFRTTISFSCKPEDVDTLVERTNAVVHRLVNDPTSMTATLDDAQKNVIKAQTLDIQRDSYWSAFIRNSLYNSDHDWAFPGQFEQRVNAVTPEVIARHVKVMIVDVPQVKAVLLPKDMIQ